MSDLAILSQITVMLTSTWSISETRSANRHGTCCGLATYLAGRPENTRVFLLARDWLGDEGAAWTARLEGFMSSTGTQIAPPMPPMPPSPPVPLVLDDGRGVGVRRFFGKVSAYGAEPPIVNRELPLLGRFFLRLGRFFASFRRLRALGQYHHSLAVETHHHLLNLLHSGCA